MRAFAHRGGAGDPAVVGLENTQAAFQHAYDLGYRLLETDVHVSSDGVLFAFHDEDLDRVTDGTGRIADLSEEDIRRVRIGGTHPIPTLADLIDAFPDATFNVDIKSDGATEALAHFIVARGVADRMLVGSFSAPRLARFRRLTEGRVRTSASPREVALLVLCPSPLLARALRPMPWVAAQVPVRTVVLGRRIEIATRRFIRKAHAAGKEVHVWTIDDPDEMRRLISSGVDGLMTDRTDVLKEVLVSSGLWSSC